MIIRTLVGNSGHDCLHKEFFFTDTESVNDPDIWKLCFQVNESSRFNYMLDINEQW